MHRPIDERTGPVPVRSGHAAAARSLPTQLDRAGEPGGPQDLPEAADVCAGALGRDPPGAAGRHARAPAGPAGPDRAGVAAVLRAWEDRFGAYVLRIDLAEFDLVVTLPPTDREQRLVVVPAVPRKAAARSARRRLGTHGRGSDAMTSSQRPANGVWPRPVPLIGDRTSARRADPTAWR